MKGAANVFIPECSQVMENHCLADQVGQEIWRLRISVYSIIDLGGWFSYL